MNELCTLLLEPLKCWITLSDILREKTGNSLSVGKAGSFRRSLKVFTVYLNCSIVSFISCFLVALGSATAVDLKETVFW